MANEQEFVDLLKKCVLSAEQVVKAFETNYEISQDFKDTIEKAKTLFQQVEQEECIDDKV